MKIQVIYNGDGVAYDVREDYEDEPIFVHKLLQNEWEEDQQYKEDKDFTLKYFILNQKTKEKESVSEYEYYETYPSFRYQLLIVPYEDHNQIKLF